MIACVLASMKAQQGKGTFGPPGCQSDSRAHVAGDRIVADSPCSRLAERPVLAPVCRPPMLYSAPVGGRRKNFPIRHLWQAPCLPRDTGEGTLPLDETCRDTPEFLAGPGYLS